MKFCGNESKCLLNWDAESWQRYESRLFCTIKAYRKSSIHMLDYNFTTGTSKLHISIRHLNILNVEVSCGISTLMESLQMWKSC